MNIVWLSWKDINHPQAGGAEIVSNEIRKRLVRDGHKVKLLTARYDDSKEVEVLEDIETYRIGNRFTVYWKAYRYFQNHFRDWPDLVVDEMNTVPFATAFYTKKRTILLTYQLAREVWFYQMQLPFSLLGYLFEPFYLRLISKKYDFVLTESESTRQDLKKYGFSENRTHVFRVGMALPPLKRLQAKKGLTDVLFLGALRPMKRPIHAVKAFEVARDRDPNLRLTVAGDTSSKYARKVKAYILRSRHTDAISLVGRVDPAIREELMRNAGVILVTSIKEGWGLIVTEANSQGTPAIGYDADGLRDSIKHKNTGLLVASGNPTEMGEAILDLFGHPTLYQKYRESAWKWSQEFTFENSYIDFCQYLDIDN